MWKKRGERCCEEGTHRRVMLEMQVRTSVVGIGKGGWIWEGRSGREWMVGGTNVDEDGAVVADAA